MRVALYIRVSTTDQTCQNQLLALRDVAERDGWQVVEVYQDNGISGAKGRDPRPGFNELMQDAARRKFDLVAVAALDRLGRSVAHVSTALAEFDALGVRFLSLREAMDTGTPTGKAMLHMAIVFSELERGLMSERIRAGLARVRKHGTRSGRPIGQQPISPQKAAAIRKDLLAGRSLRSTARAHPPRAVLWHAATPARHTDAALRGRLWRAGAACERGRA
jgi:DNA invertase Pin-like site-specific DNA recombinase